MRRPLLRRRPRRTGPRAFTLLEVMIALVITGLVTSIGYATLTSGFDVQRRTAEVRDRVTHQAAAREFLRDALRHAVEGATAGEGWQLATDPTGRTARFAFLTRGIGSRRGASGQWQVVLSARDSVLWLMATSLEASLPPIAFPVADATAMRVTAMSVSDRRWQAGWSDGTRLPSAIAVELLDAADAPIGPPIIARRHALESW
ncbi:MAG: type II secretion system protein [Gemmatimonadaceae bacterium]|nr:type II secretion system protein [Gemmatimonadaceae bacterium]